MDIANARGVDLQTVTARSGRAMRAPHAQAALEVSAMADALAARGFDVVVREAHRAGSGQAATHEQVAGHYDRMHRRVSVSILALDGSAERGRSIDTMSAQQKATRALGEALGDVIGPPARDEWLGDLPRGEVLALRERGAMHVGDRMLAEVRGRDAVDAVAAADRERSGKAPEAPANWRLQIRHADYDVLAHIEKTVLPGVTNQIEAELESARDRMLDSYDEREPRLGNADRYDVRSFEKEPSRPTARHAPREWPAPGTLPPTAPGGDPHTPYPVRPGIHYAGGGGERMQSRRPDTAGAER